MRVQGAVSCICPSVLMYMCVLVVKFSSSCVLMSGTEGP